jgi:hypothetical protein
MKKGEPATKLIKQKDSLDIDPVVAIWADGYEAEVPDLLAKDLDEVTNPTGAKSSCKMWEGEHSTTKYGLYLCKRQDRHLLASLFEQSRQVAQCRVDVFADEGEGSLKKAENLMKLVSVADSRDEFPRAELHDKVSEFLLTHHAISKRS